MPRYTEQLIAIGRFNCRSREQWVLEMESGRGTSRLVLANLSPISLDSPSNILSITTISPMVQLARVTVIRAFTVADASYKRLVHHFLKMNPKH